MLASSVVHTVVNQFYQMNALLVTRHVCMSVWRSFLCWLPPQNPEEIPSIPTVKKDDSVGNERPFSYVTSSGFHGKVIKKSKVDRDPFRVADAASPVYGPFDLTVPKACISGSRSLTAVLYNPPPRRFAPPSLPRRKR